MPAASYGISESSVSMTRLSTSLRSSERLIVLVMSSSMRSLSIVDKPTAFCIVSGIESIEGAVRPQLFDYTCSVREAETAFVFRPQMRDLYSVFRELAADTKATRDFISTSSLNDHSAQRRVRHERRRADRVGRLFVRVVVFAREQLAGRRTLPHGRVSANSGQTI